MRWRATAVMALALAALGGGLYFYMQGKLRLDTPREWYFIYVAGLLALALVLTPFRRLGTIVLLLAALEIGLGIGSAALFQFGVVKTLLLPQDDYLEPPLHRPPLLQPRPLAAPPPPWG